MDKLTAYQDALFPLLTISSSLILSRISGTKNSKFLLIHSATIGILPLCLQRTSFQDKLFLIIGCTGAAFALKYSLNERYSIKPRVFITQSILCVGLAIFCSKKTIFPSDPRLKSGKSSHERRADYSQIRKENLQYMREGKYASPGGDEFSLSNGLTLQEQTLTQGLLHDPVSFSGEKETVIEVANEDCLLVTQRAQQTSKTAIVMFASSREPGGAFSTGEKGSQEEEICYRSTFGGFTDQQLANPNFDFLLATNTGDIRDVKGDIPNNVLLTPNVQVFRDQNYHLMDQPIEMGVISCSALVRIGQEGISYTPDERKRMKALIRTQLFIAYQNGYEAFISGAFGCGKFANPPREVAEIHRELLDEEFVGVFSYIGFAVLQDQYDSSKDNFSPFKETFA